MKIDPIILAQAAQLYDLDLSCLHPLGGMEGMALAFTRDDHDYVLKVTPKNVGQTRQIEQIKAKSQFITYLSDNGVKVARPVQSPKGQWVEVVETETAHYLVTAATKADGTHINLSDPVQATPTLFQAWGRVTAQMHRLAKSYTSWQKYPPGGDDPNPIIDWQDEHDSFRDWSQDDVQIQTKWSALAERIQTLPVERESYGLIHNDLHPMNFLVDDRGEITVIDFDVCTFHFFVKDIAIALFFADWLGKPPRGTPKETYLTQFLRNFMQAYASENNLDDFWFSQLPLFTKHHQILLYIVFSHEWQKPNPWQAKTLQRWRDQILNDKPVVRILF